MKCKASFKNPGLPMLFLLLLAVFTIPPVMAGDAANTSQNPDYWIHLDPVSDKPLNDTFVFTGKTNIPAGELVNISTYLSSFPHSTKYVTSVPWNREYTVSVREGPGGQNTFSTPPIQIIPSKVDGGDYEKIRENDEYIVIAEYQKNTTSALGTILYWIWAQDVSLPFWIHVDPVSDKHVNDTLVITGTTNVPVGEYLNIVSRPAETTLQTNETPVAWSMQYAASVQAGSGGQNTFETSPVRITPSSAGGKKQVVRAGDEYVIVAKYLPRNLSAENTPHYRILAPESSIRDPYITIDTIEEHFIGDRFFINGSTYLPENTSLFFSIQTEEYRHYPLLHHPNFTGIVNEKVKIIRWENGSSIWSAEVNTTDYKSTFYPDENWTVHVWPYPQKDQKDILIATAHLTLRPNPRPITPLLPTLPAMASQNQSPPITISVVPQKTPVSKEIPAIALIIAGIVGATQIKRSKK
jgi:hypothetical protein